MRRSPVPSARRADSRYTRAGHALHAEWTKARTAGGTIWLLLAVIAATVAAGTAVAAGCAQDPARVSLSGVDLGQAVVAVQAVLVISGEYGTGMILLTLTAMPRRTIMLAAKAAIITGLVVAGTVAVLGSVLAGRLILPGHGFTPEHGYPLLSLAAGPWLRAAAGSVLYLALIGLLGLGIATAAQDSAAAIGIVLGLLYLFPVVTAAVANPLAAAPGADRAHVGRAGHPGDNRPARPAHQPVGGHRRARRLGRGSHAGRRPPAAASRQLSGAAAARSDSRWQAAVLVISHRGDARAPQLLSRRIPGARKSPS
jgi:ABC-2 type transport system permease protein